MHAQNAMPDAPIVVAWGWADDAGMLITRQEFPESAPPAPGTGWYPWPQGDLAPGHIWRRVGDGWSQVPDRRGCVYRAPDDRMRTITIGGVLEAVPDGWLLMSAADRDLLTAQRAALVRIEALRDARINAPIDYQGVTLDADAAARDNVRSKLLELQQCDALMIEVPAELLVWRDHANTTHAFESAAALEAWLGGLAVAMSQRGTLAYAWSWQAKAVIKSAGVVSTADLVAALTALEGGAAA